jgi:hypothetical protein
MAEDDHGSRFVWWGIFAAGLLAMAILAVAVIAGANIE